MRGSRTMPRRRGTRSGGRPIPRPAPARSPAPRSIARLAARFRSGSRFRSPARGGPGTEGLVEPFHDEDFSTRTGYDERFLGLRVPMPKVLDRKIVSKLDSGAYRLPYEHFTVVMHRTRRLALFTASNVDASPARKKPEPGRDYTRAALTGLVHDNDREKWFTDPRIPATH